MPKTRSYRSKNRRRVFKYSPPARSTRTQSYGTRDDIVSVYSYDSDNDDYDVIPQGFVGFFSRESSCLAAGSLTEEHSLLAPRCQEHGFPSGHHFSRRLELTGSPSVEYITDGCQVSDGRFPFVESDSPSVAVAASRGGRSLSKSRCQEHGYSMGRPVSRHHHELAGSPSVEYITDGCQVSDGRFPFAESDSQSVAVAAFQGRRSLSKSRCQEHGYSMGRPVSRHHHELAGPPRIEYFSDSCQVSEGRSPSVEVASSRGRRSPLNSRFQEHRYSTVRPVSHHHDHASSYICRDNIKVPFPYDGEVIPVRLQQPSHPSFAYRNGSHKQICQTDYHGEVSTVTKPRKHDVPYLNPNLEHSETSPLEKWNSSKIRCDRYSDDSFSPTDHSVFFHDRKCHETSNVARHGTMDSGTSDRSDVSQRQYHPSLQLPTRPQVDESGVTSVSEFLDSGQSFLASEAVRKLPRPSNLSQDIRSVPLLIELPKKGSKIPDRMLKEGSDHMKRWALMNCIYVIMPSSFQVGIARTLDVPHGHFPLMDLLPKLCEFSTHEKAPTVNIKFIGYQANYRDDFLYIRNDVERLDLPWAEIDSCLTNIETKKPANVDRQKKFVDIGYAGTQCVGRNSQCDLGLTAPRLLATSRQESFSKNFFSKTSQVDDALGVIGDCLSESILDDRVERWGRRLGNLNRKEAARLHETHWSPSDRAICSIHKDSQNGKISQVSFCNRVFRDRNKQWIRQGAVMYFRRSIDDYEERRKIHGDYLTHVRKCLELELKARWKQSTEVLLKTDKMEIAEGLHAIKIKCSCEVESYYQPFVAAINRIGSQFELSELDLASVLFATSQSACSAAYTLAASEVLLLENVKRGADIGHRLLEIITNIETSPGKLIEAPLRFSKYSSFDLESSKQWRKHVKKCCLEMKLLREKGGSMTQDDYNGMHRLIMAEFNGVGNLRANHLIGIATILGLLPLSLFKFVDGGATKAYETIKVIYGKEVPNKEETINNVHHLMETIIGHRVTRRYAENTFCKVGRIICNSDKKYYDIIDTRFPLLRVEGAKIKLMYKKDDNDAIDCIFDVADDSAIPVLPSKSKRKRSRAWMAAAQRS